MAGALRRRGDEHLGAGDDLEAAGMVLADPRLVVVQSVEMLDQLHVAVDRERRGSPAANGTGEENAGAQIAVVHGLFLRVCAVKPSGSRRLP